MTLWSWEDMMLHPSMLTTAGLLAAITNNALAEDYREACIAELAARIDRPSTAQQPAAADQIKVRQPKAA